MIYLVVLSALYALHLLLKLHWITTVVIGGFLLLRISGHRKWYKKKIVYERKFEEVSEYLDMLLYAFVKEEKVERALVNVDAAMVDGPMRGVLQNAIDHMHMTFDETDVMRDSLQMIERPLMTPDELKSIPKGEFVVMKTGTHPMRTRLRLFLDWGITFDPNGYRMPERAARKIAYVNRDELAHNIQNRRENSPYNTEDTK